MVSNRIVISGYYGFDNAGDEAVLFSIISLLREVKANVKITVLSHNPEKTAELYGVQAVNRWKPIEVWQALKECGLLISGGGSLLQDVHGPKSVIYYLGVVKMAQFLKKPVAFYAQGIGPISGRLSKTLMKLIANRVDVITVRDQGSLEDLKAMGVTKPLTRVTADPVLGIESKNINLTLGGKILSEAGVQLEDKENKPVLGIGLREWPNFEEGINQIAQALKVVEEKGWQPVFIPMHFPEDVQIGRKISRELGHKAIVLTDNYTVEETFSLIGNCHMILGMRLHTLIMATVMGVPSVAISYDPKVDRFTELANLPSPLKVEDLTAFELVTRLQELKYDLAIKEQDLDKKREMLREKARESAYLALSLAKF